MLTAFVVCALLGGILLLFGMLGGDHGAEIHADLHVDVDHDVDVGHLGSFLHSLPFLSLRFWSYGLFTFGIIGLLLTFLANFGVLAAFTIALISGITCGSAVVFAIRALDRSMVSTGATLEDLTGALGKVTVAVRGAVPGRIRCELKGEILDLLAITSNGQTLEIGSPVIVTAIENDRAVIMPQAALLGQDTQTQSTQ